MIGMLLVGSVAVTTFVGLGRVEIVLRKVVARCKST